ncbi:MAG: serine hydrolase [Saprospiraceae bacterium]|nr:serine hydrolase [Saprospiraceae bacterium]
MKHIHLIYTLFCFAVSFHSAKSQNYLQREEEWVSGILDNMTLEEKIGQMIMVRAYSKGDIAEKDYIRNLINTYHIGGICFFQGKPDNQVNYTRHFQKISKYPLFIATDGEWGLGMRFPQDAVSFPRNLQLGAIQDEKLIYQLGKEIGNQCKALGINFNFSPVVDLNNNPKNPVIYERSFGESKENVTAKAFLMSKGLEDSGVLSCAKHFPGHGDTHVDSHEDLPVLDHTRDSLMETDVFPFRRLAAQNIASIMVGHLHLPNIDNRPNRPASLSRIIVHDMLRVELAFKGLIVTDALDMKAVTKHFPSGIAEAEAVVAGNDILLLPEDVFLAIETIKRYIEEGKISVSQINSSVFRILSAKYKAGLSRIEEVDEVNPEIVLNNPFGFAIKAKVIEASMTLVKDDLNQIPVKEIFGVNTATLSVNVVHKSTFQTRIEDYTEANHYQLLLNELPSRKNSLLNTFAQFDRVIVGIHSQLKSRSSARDLPPQLISFLKEIQKQTQIIIVFFGNPYFVEKLEDFPAVLLAYDNENEHQDIAAQSLFGANKMEGKLPVKVSKDMFCGYGIFRSSSGRLGYGIPEQVGLYSHKLKAIDSLAQVAINSKAMPGGQIVVAKDGKIVWQKEYGYLAPNWDKVQSNTIYDVASLTKILATTLTTMKLYDEKRLSLQRPIRFYITDLISTDKDSLTLESMMAHYAGLKSYIPFYEETLMPSGKKRVPDTLWYSSTFSPEFSIPVSEKLFLKTNYVDSIWTKVFKSGMRTTKSYKYSDLGFLLTQKVVEGISGQKLDDYTLTNFYQPLGLRYTRFKPLESIPQSHIAPSEVDDYFRMSIIRGTVHDMAAAMLGGVAGHAGLFSTAKETTVIMQMLLNGGSYGGNQFFSPETVRLFTSRHMGSTRRGLGFDMKELNESKMESTSDLVSDETFGHTGFTGGVTFADPQHQIIFTFLTNRTFPNMSNNTLHTRKFRPKMQSIIYKALIP